MKDLPARTCMPTTKQELLIINNMVMLSFLEELLIYTIVLLVPLYFITKSMSKRNPSLPTDWPILGMVPALIANRNNFHEFAAGMLFASGHSFMVRGPPGSSSMRFFTTCDPANVRHIFTTNFDNYPKGEELAEVFGVLAGTIIAADGESWRRQRARIQFVLTRPELLAFLARSCRDKVANCLVPMLERMASSATQFDMEDLLGRLVFDLTVMVVLGMDSCCLSPDMPPIDVASALDTIMEVTVYRHSVPTSCWKLISWLNIGWERKYAAAEALLRRFAADKISRRMAGSDHSGEATRPVGDMLSHYTDDPEFLTDEGEPTDFLYRSFINFMVMFRDPMSSALPWLVFSLATHPEAVSAMRHELAPIAARKGGAGSGDASAMVIFETEETKDLVYQRAALFESLRLYPIGPLERKAVLADDVLPSGHKLRSGDTVMVSFYAMGRLESLWGEDCREYRPERWILEDDGHKRLRHVPSYKFVSFNTGPRSCLGKKIAVAHLTSIVATLVWNFDVEVLERHVVQPKLSVILQMRSGLMVKVKKRQHFNK
ncbi:unnamed protein product [Urochloa humidicola]